MIFSKEKIDQIRGLKFTSSDFEKFTNPSDPRYNDYKDRHEEHWHDKGWNNAIDYVLNVPLEKHKKNTYNDLPIPKNARYAVFLWTMTLFSVVVLFIVCVAALVHVIICR